jgi:hypothetical protein
MKVPRATTEINAPPETVWRILTDAPHYADWDPGIIRLEGKIGLGEQIAAHTKASPDRAFKVTVSEIEPPRRMVWRSGMPLGLFQGVRTYTLDPLPDGRTRFTVQEVFSGLLLPLIGRSIPDLDPVFAGFAAGLKAQAERA